MSDCEGSDPLTPVTVMVYKPGCVSLAVVMVRKACAGGVAEAGLTAHCGAVPVAGTGVTVQGTVSKETELLKLPVAAMLMVAMEDPPGSTDDGERPVAMVRVNPCAWAAETEAADSRESSSAKTRVRMTCLGFTMRG